MCLKGRSVTVLAFSDKTKKKSNLTQNTNAMLESIQESEQCRVVTDKRINCFQCDLSDLSKECINIVTDLFISEVCTETGLGIRLGLGILWSKTTFQ